MKLHCNSSVVVSGAGEAAAAAAAGGGRPGGVYWGGSGEPQLCARHPPTSCNMTHVYSCEKCEK